jgi:hypothetical protein
MLAKVMPERTREVELSV